MRKIVLLFFLLFSLSVFSQNKQEIILGLYKSTEWSPIDIFPFNMTESISYEEPKSFKNYGLNVGLNLDNGFNIMLEIAFMNLNNGSSYGGPESRNMKTIKAGLNYRFFNRFKFSPKIAVRMGIFPYSDLKGKQVDAYTFVQEMDGGYFYSYSFERWNGYANIDLLLSIRLKNILIDVGPGINYSSFLLNPKYGSPKNYHDLGLGFKIGISYVFPFGKHEDNKNEKIIKHPKS
jgi:hypothetical protein